MAVSPHFPLEAPSSTPDVFALTADLLDPPEHPYAADPVAFASDVLGFTAWSMQRDIMEAVRDNPLVAVRACHGPGKTAIAAQVALWFLKTKRNSRVITTAPTWKQVEQLLWREIRAAVARSAQGTFPKPSATKLEVGDEWFAIGMSTNEPERFQGHHAEHLLLIVDEASGVDEKIYEASEGFQTAEGAHVLLLGNPTKIGGQFFRAFGKERAKWRTFTISVFDTPNYTGEQVPADVARRLPRRGWAEEKAAQWGEASPMYQVRVLGVHPSSAADTVIPMIDVEEAQRHKLPAPTGPRKDRATIAVDVARFGDDETVIAVKHGGLIRIVEVLQGKDTVMVSKRAAHHGSRYARPRFVIDDSGVGGGVTDQLRAMGHTVHPFNGAERAHEPDEYPNARSELWFTMADAIGDVDLDDDEQLMADLTAPTYKLDKRDRRVVEPKDETKKRLGRSPDRGDAVLMTLWHPPVLKIPDGDGGQVEQAITAGLMDERW